MDTEICARCGKVVAIDSDEHLYGESIGDEFVCEGCVTGAEEQAFGADYMALGDAMASAGLSGDDVDVETMPDDEFELRESLAQIIYENDPDDIANRPAG